MECSIDAFIMECGYGTLTTQKWVIIKVLVSSAVVAWFAKAPLSHSVDCSLSASGGSNPAWGMVLAIIIH